MEYVRCGLCGSKTYDPYLAWRDLNLLPEDVREYRLVKCRDCGLVYQNPRPESHALASLYPDDYDQYTIAVKDERSPMARLSRRYGLQKRCRAVFRHKQAGRLLDIGCATGDFLAAVGEHPGWEVHGIELNERAAAYARTQLHLDVRTGTLEALELPAEHFDAVTLWNVLEHLADPLADLRTLHRLLKPGGILVFNTPNLDSLDARLFGRYWIGYELPRHFYVFAPRTLAMLLGKSGFRIVEQLCLYGSHAATMSSLRFWLRDSLGRSRLGRSWQRRLERVLFSNALRALTLPGFLVLDRLRLSTPLTVVSMKAAGT